MEIRLSARIRRVRPSATLAVTNRAAELRAAGRDIIGLGAGEPDFDTPEHIKDAAKRALDAGFTKYTAVDGIPELKRAIQDKFERDNGLKFTAEQIIVTCGGKQAFYWVSYPDMVLLAEGEPVILRAGLKEGFKVSPEQVETAITPKTRMVLLNSPSNPTGVCYTRAELEAIAEVLRRHPNVLVCTDDIYEHIIWGGEPFANIVVAAPDLYERTIVLHGVSKAYSMTGWRIGYAAGPAVLINAMKKIQSQSTSNPTSIAQKAAVEALTGDQSFIGEMVAVFKKRHDAVMEGLNAIKGIRCLPAQGAFYLFPSFEGAIAARDDVRDDVEMAEMLLNEAGVALVPGSAFGAQGYMRLSFATGMENLEKALERLKGVLG